MSHIHIYNSGHSSSSAIPASAAATETEETPKDSTTPLSETQTLSAPLTLIRADALKVKATSSETKSSKKPKIVEDGPTTVKISTSIYDSDDSDNDDSFSSDEDDRKRKKPKAKTKTIALMTKTLKSKEKKNDKKKGPKIKNGFVQPGYTLADVGIGAKKRKEGVVWSMMEWSVSGTVEELEGGGTRIVYVETRREIFVISVEGEKKDVKKDDSD